uniref:phosphoribosylaminoimidazolesuccinocarboxamide synthase n=1 Tax=Aegilops tauschii subsp. strangulata TaxID=200361 RepID=A0A453L0U9_AEGTS
SDPSHSAAVRSPKPRAAQPPRPAAAATHPPQNPHLPAHVSLRAAGRPPPREPAQSSPPRPLTVLHTRSPRLSMSTSSRPRATPLAAAGGSGAAPSLLAADPGHRDSVILAARGAMTNCLGETHLDLVVPGLRLAAKGKVRDVYESGEHLVLVTTDRQSAFDRVLASIPFKGQVLNETSLWWFNRTSHITPNAVVSSPDRNVTIAKRCSVFPVEFVVRGFVTGSTDTSLWTVYNKGVRNYCGNAIPDGMLTNIDTIRMSPPSLL